VINIWRGSVSCFWIIMFCFHLNSQQNSAALPKKYSSHLFWVTSINNHVQYVWNTHNSSGKNTWKKDISFSWQSYQPWTSLDISTNKTLNCLCNVLLTFNMSIYLPENIGLKLYQPKTPYAAGLSTLNCSYTISSFDEH